ncbi:hypothetical protein ACFUJR_27860 [Streptomyces sp. NPDC057271]|uniref:hypothetical protein n=1 Tax=unclassified Streptomyces TaxID=2593676 RepID=UPI00362C92FC
MDDEQRPQPGSSVPHAYGNALARRWAPELPRPLVGGFLTLLYALRAMASADGRLRYERDGKAITIAQIAKACRSEQKDVRDYLEAAIAAGVVAIVDDGHGTGGNRGRAVMYAIVLCPSPDWNAAAGKVWVAAQLKKEQRAAKAARKAAREAAATAQTSGDCPPTPDPGTSGDSPPTPGAGTSGDSPPRGVGGQSPLDLGGQSPDHPGITHVLPHEVADVGPQPEDARTHASGQWPDTATPATAPPPPRLVPPQSGGRPPGTAKARTKSGTCQGQRALLLSVQTPPTVDEVQAQRADEAQQPVQAARARSEPTDDDIRHAIHTLGSGAAMTLYGPNRVWPVLARLGDPNSPRTGT